MYLDIKKGGYIMSKLTKKDVDIVRNLAGRVAEIASLSVQREKKKTME